ncbi:MAG: NapC/NirT family cytochrome c [Planctomycetes bacterium]|nr:NapC/NirT family cytochrome c [Planctomycetota bacterium]
MTFVLKGIRIFWSFIALVCSNFISLIGSTLTTVAVFGFLALMAMDIYQPFHQPYIGILIYMVMPGVFLAGLALIPVGILLQRWRGGGNRFTGNEGWPQIDFGNVAHRRRFLVFTVLTVVNAVVLGTMSYQGVEFMDSNAFCGTVCHSVMEPEYAAYQDSPHSRTHCVACHIGPGADMFVRYKLAGLRQVYRVNAGGYDKPIKSPVHNLRPSRETCERCHWPDKFHGDRMWVRTKFKSDEKNTRLTTAVMLKLGGARVDGGRGAGIHWHVATANEITYISTDSKRQEIPWVQVKRPNGEVEIFAVAGAEKDPAKDAAALEALVAQGKAEKRTMDCIDCHNRPTHEFQLPNRALDVALARGGVDLGLPYLKQQGLKLLKAEYANGEEAEAAIGRGLTDYYGEKYPEVAKAKAAEIAGAGRAVAAVWKRNVYPRMKIGWGTYPVNSGHEDFPGCFRCHDDNHTSRAGRVIKQDCDLCHVVVAEDEEKFDMEKKLGD